MSEAEEALKKCLEKTLDELGYKERDIEIVPFSSEASNFTTVLFEVNVTSPGKETLNLFAKSAAIGEKLREVTSADMLYDTEYRFYTKLVTVFQELYNKNEVPVEERLIFPKFYGATLEKGEEVLILENLSKSKYSLFDRKKPVDWEHASSSIKNLARYHALGFALKYENPDIFNEFDSASHLKKTIENMGPQLENMVTEKLKLVKDEYKAKVAAIIADQELMMNAMNGSLGSGKNTLIHSDYRTSNIMYKRQNGKVMSIPVDYQTIKVGNVLVDILYFVFLNTDEQFRKYHWSQLLDYYYTELSTSLRNLKLDITEIYPRENFDEDLKTFLPTNIMTTLMLLPLVVVETSAAPDMSADDTSLENFVVASNEIAQTRIDGVMRDFARLGVF